MANRSPKPLSLQDAEAAAALLGVTLSDVSVESLRTAFRAKLRQVHPDASSAPDADAADVIARLTTARARLLLWLSMQPKSDCTSCKGRGYVRTGALGTKPCPFC